MQPSWARLSVLATVVALSPATAIAECALVGLSYSMEHAEVVFAGTVIRTDPRPEYPAYRIATFKVDTVWKGELDPEVTLSEANITEAIRFEPSRSYLIFGYAPPREVSSAPPERFPPPPAPPGLRQISPCESKPLEDAQRDLQTLGPGGTVTRSRTSTRP